ncbi:MAG: hypothetical protein Kow0059_22020 [Candidatus Sumerlaeia bacterium]
MTLESDFKKYETLLIINELSEIIKSHTTALNQLSSLADSGTCPLPADQIERLRSHLRDNQNMLLREFNGLQQGGRTNKTYDKRYVCEQCHCVFLMPLPGGLCDECRGKQAPDPYKQIRKRPATEDEGSK